MKSIAYVSKKYDGDLKIKADNGIFSISILLPDNPAKKE
ncbi:MAG: ATP-binding protein [Bacilli bacterium]|nr:ATP-binding protein [Bacilli bacterium]